MNLRSLILTLFIVFSITQAIAETFATRLANAALTLTHTTVTYDPSYFRLDYPMGDVPADKGVCTDVIIRAYRQLGLDLQQKVHEDMRANFGKYPQNWGLKAPDRNIDHRRVPNLRQFFSRFGNTLPISQNQSDYSPGDIVTWMLPGNLPHIGIVTNKRNSQGHPLIVHNIGQGQVLEDMLFSYPITGHYRYAP